jgi:hypothetical protein
MGPMGPDRILIVICGPGHALRVAVLSFRISREDTTGPQRRGRAIRSSASSCQAREGALAVGSAGFADTVAAVLTWSDRPLHDDLDGGPARTRKPPRDEASWTAGTAEADYQESLSRFAAPPLLRTQESLSRLSGEPVLMPRDVLEAGGLRRGAPVTARPSANMMIAVAGVSQDRWPGRNLFGFAA